MAGTLVANTINTDTGLFSTNNAYSGIAKAWANYDGTTSTPTIRGSFNISSITKNSSGNHTVNFTTAMTNANYSVLVSCSASGAEPRIGAALSTSTSSCVVATGYSAFTFQDELLTCISIFGA